MLSPENNAGTGGAENRQISQRDLVTLTAKAHAYDLIQQVNQQQRIIADLNAELQKQSGITTNFLMVAVNELPEEFSRVLYEEVKKVDPDLAQVLEKMIEHRKLTETCTDEA